MVTPKAMTAFVAILSLTTISLVNGQSPDTLFPGQSLTRAFAPNSNQSSDIIVIANAEVGGDITLKCRPEKTSKGSEYPWVSMSPVGTSEWLYIPYEDPAFDESEANRGEIECIVMNDSLPPKYTKYSLTADYLGMVPELNQVEQEALKSIYDKCCSEEGECEFWKANEKDGNENYDFCHIQGQICNATGGMLRLDMSAWNLKCPFPYNEIAQFTSLRHLRMGQNSFTGDWEEILEALSGLENLESLHINDVPDISGKLSRGSSSSPLCPMAQGALRVLDLSNSSIEGSIPECLVNSDSRLVNIDLGWNRLTGSIPDKFDDNTNITWFVVNQNHLNGSIPKSWSSVTNLVLFNVSNNGLEGTIPGEITNNQNLIHILARNNLLSGSIPSALGMHPPLITLDLRNNSFSEFPEDWSTITPELQAMKVQAIRLSNNSLSGTIPQGLSAMLSLMELGLAYNNLSGSLPTNPNTNFRNMLLFNVSGNSLTGGIPESYSSMRMFRQLNNLVNTRNGSGLNYTFVFDLDNNQLSGDIPDFLSISSLQRQLDWTAVNLTGNDFDNACDESFEYALACKETVSAPAPAPAESETERKEEETDMELAPAPAPEEDLSGAAIMPAGSEAEEKEEDSVMSRNTPQDQSSSSDSGLSGGAIAGIVIASLVGLLLLVALAVFIIKKRHTFVPAPASSKFDKFQDDAADNSPKSVGSVPLSDIVTPSV